MEPCGTLQIMSARDVVLLLNARSCVVVELSKHSYQRKLLPLIPVI